MLSLFLKHVVQFLGLPAVVLSGAWWGYKTGVVAPDGSAAEWFWTGLFSLMILELLVWRMKDSLGLSVIVVLCISLVIGLPYLAIADSWDVNPGIIILSLDYGGVLVVLFLFTAFSFPVRLMKNGYTALDVMERTGNLPPGSLTRALKRAAGDD